MEKYSFLDTNIIVNYASYQKERSSKIVIKCYMYIKNKKEKFLICYAVIEELSNIMEKRAIIYKEVLKKIQDNEYQLGTSKDLSKRDLPYAEKLYLANKEIEEKKLKEIFASERDIFEIEIDRFLKDNVDEKVIPIEQIKIELVNMIHDIIPNHADCKILASAFQLQETREIFLFVTADSKDLDPNGYEFLKEQFEINFPDKKHKFPELLNLMFT